MLFGYPVAATKENWLHQCLIHAIQVIHQKVDLGEALPKWPELFPNAHRAKVVRLRTLPKLFEEYRTALALILKTSRDAVLDAMHAQNRIDDLLECSCDCPSISDLPKTLREPIKEIFNCGFDLLTDFKIRQVQYKHIHSSMVARVCPFCGLETFNAPHAPQEDFDHYLPRSIYPFAAVNLKNLAPMGHKCNSGYKRAQDILNSDDGNRRRAFNPYQPNQVQLSLLNSEINPLTDGPFVRTWHLEITPSTPEVATWEKVFSVHSRYTTDVLEDRNFWDWIGDFKQWFDGRPVPDDDEKLIAAVNGYANVLASTGFRDKAFIKAAVFAFLHNRLLAGCQRVLALMRDATGMQQPVQIA
ncbi:MAG: hypothetical protein Q7K57_59550 [Burkholderiaceae bacterium]|nr:hypothetical protein [Burkholderiaceae bacterium]